MDVKEIITLLDNSQDAETIAIEIVSHETLLFDLTSARGGLRYIFTHDAADMCLGQLIRELWDIAYSYGYQDGKAEAEEEII